METDVIVRRLVPASIAFLVAACAPGAPTPGTFPSPPPTTTSTVDLETSFPATSTTTVPTTTTTTTTHVESRVGTLVTGIEAATGGISLAPDGTLYVADIGTAPARVGQRIYQVRPDGSVTLLVDSELIEGASGNVIGPDGALYQSSLQRGTIVRIDADGSASVFAEGLGRPVGITTDGEDGFLVADCGTRRVAHVSASGVVTGFVRHPDFNCPNGIARAPDGTVYVANFGDGKVFRIDPGGPPELFVTMRGNNNGHLAVFDDRLWVVDRGGNRVYVVSWDGAVIPVAGTGARGTGDGPGSSATFNLPNGIAISPEGRIFVNQSASDGARNAPVAIRVIDVVGP